MNHVALASAFLEIEALLMLCRAHLLQRDEVRFTPVLLEARAKLGELTARILTAKTEIFFVEAVAEPQVGDVDGGQVTSSETVQTE